MTDNREDADRIFIRGRWGTNRYVYNPRNPIGRALIVGSLLFAVCGVFLLKYNPELLSGTDGWDGDELRSAVSVATTELAREAEFGPGTINYEDILQAHIAKHGRSSKEALTIALASEPPRSALYYGGTEHAYYSVTAKGTGTAFCLNVHATMRKMAMKYDSVIISVHDGACSAP
ncbi:hypothetical protein [Streptomyces yunnanensis]|uniref:Uncharacterized protein n=1 Tax=Streptomyces yunnanensis TaxID=156453 RepID=A0A9X8QYH3_9ACTN|nr:hypothetical protein [Streptomyces yunnanensis]SHN08045.1 hypothetical protein SAMN05216268_11957 [Streptomyces yunnanensis]